MKQSMRNIAFININRFNPILCDGVSVSSLELLEFLMHKGHQAEILTFCTQEPAKQYFFQKALRQHAPELRDKNVKSFSYKLCNIPAYEELLPFDQTELFANQDHIIQLMIRKIKEKEINYLITVEDDLISLLPGILLGIPGAHFFHSPTYLHAYQHAPFFSKFLKNVKLFAVSGYLQAKIKNELGLDSDIWHPLFDLGRYRLKKNGSRNSHLGYYSAGRHKGDAIVNQLALDIPNREFLVIGRFYTHGFAAIPGNLHWLGDNPDYKRFYNSIRLLLVPSLTEEGFPRVILEAAVNGIPTLANSVGGIPEALGNSGLLVEVGPAELEHLEIGKLVAIYRKCIERIIANKNIYMELKHNAIKRARVYEDNQRESSMKNLENMLRH